MKKIIRLTESDLNNLVRRVINETDRNKFKVAKVVASDETNLSDVIVQNRKWAEDVYKRMDSMGDSDSLDSLEKTVGKLYLAKLWIKDSDKKGSIQDKIDSKITSYIKPKKSSED